MSIRTEWMLLFLLAGCGDALVPGDYFGEPLLQVGGAIVLEDAREVAPNSLWVGLAWAGEAETSEERSQSVELITSDLVWYEAMLFAEPRDEALMDVPWHDEPVAIGVLVLFERKNDDHHWSADEEVIATGDETLIAWTEGDFGDNGGGYQAFRFAGPPCDDFGVVPPNTEAIPLRDYSDSPQLFDLDCDGLPREWMGLAPPPEE